MGAGIAIQPSLYKRSQRWGHQSAGLLRLGPADIHEVKLLLRPAPEYFPARSREHDQSSRLLGKPGLACAANLRIGIKWMDRSFLSGCFLLSLRLFLLVIHLARCLRGRGHIPTELKKI